jgi:hypothetical protein
MIGILVSNKSFRKGILEIYQKYNQLDLTLITFTPNDIFWGNNLLIGLCQKQGALVESMFTLPDAVYNQCYNNSLDVFKPLIGIIGEKNFFNAINSFNKLDIYSFLTQSKLKSHVPNTFLFKDINITEILEEYKLVYIKPFYGNKGQKVFRTELMENGDIHISLHSLAPRYICRKTDNINKIFKKLISQDFFLVQKGILSSHTDIPSYDIRVLVQKNFQGNWVVSSIACRVAFGLYFNASVFEEIFDIEDFIPNLFPNESEIIIQKLNAISIDAAKILETQIGLLGELSVDFMLDAERNLWIIEINGMPQKNIYDYIDGYKHLQLIYGRPLEYAYYLSNSKRS